MGKPEADAEKKWFRVNLQVHEKGRLAVAGFIALSMCPESAIRESVQDLTSFCKGMLFDPEDSAHTVFPLCDEDIQIAEQLAATWPIKNQVSALIAFSFD